MGPLAREEAHWFLSTNQGPGEASPTQPLGYGPGGPGALPSPVGQPRPRPAHLPLRLISSTFSGASCPRERGPEMTKPCPRPEALARSLAETFRDRPAVGDLPEPDVRSSGRWTRRGRGQKAAPAGHRAARHGLAVTTPPSGRSQTGDPQRPGPGPRPETPALCPPPKRLLFPPRGPAPHRGPSCTVWASFIRAPPPGRR